jgi:hypothetical protein
MNRRERRAAKAMAKGRSLDRAVAVHESGHAVGRFLTAARLGFAPDDSVSHIEAHVAAPLLGLSYDGKTGLRSQATTYGPMFSRGLEEFIRAEIGGDGEVSHIEIARILVKAREAGLDVDDWFRAKAFSNVLGPMAEAKFLGKPFGLVWNEYTSECDISASVMQGTLAGLAPEQIEQALDETIDIAAQEIARAEVWRAILTLADSLKPGRNCGRKVTAIIARSLVHAAALA